MDQEQTQEDPPFSEELKKLLEVSGGEALTIEAIENILAERGAGALLTLMSLPFITPIPLPGVSIVFGVLIAILAFQIVFAHRLQLPQYLARRQIDHSTLTKLVNISCKLLRKVERYFKPRWLFMFSGSLRYVSGLVIAIMGLTLSLPIPPFIPFTNSLPAISLSLFGIGFLEEDGVFVFLGHVVAVLTWVYLIVWWDVIMSGFRMIFNHFF